VARPQSPNGGSRLGFSAALKGPPSADEDLSNKPLNQRNTAKAFRNYGWLFDWLLTTSRYGNFLPLVPPGADGKSTPDALRKQIEKGGLNYL